MGNNKSSPDQYQLRLPPGLRDAVKALADTNRRSMNAEIIEQLESRVEAEKSIVDARAELRQLMEHLRNLEGAQSLLVGAVEDALKDLNDAGKVSPESQKLLTKLVEHYRAIEAKNG